MVTYGVLTAGDRFVVLFNITDLVANSEGTVNLPITFEDLLFCGLIVFLFIVNYMVYILVNYMVYILVNYMVYLHTFSTYIQ